MTSTTKETTKVTIGKTHRISIALAGALFAVLGLAASADAARVANPGNVSIVFEGGTLQIRDQVFDAASEDDPATATGTVAANGAVTINSFNFPDLPPIDGPLGPINVSINVLSSSGNINPLTGAGSFSASIRIDVDGTGVGGDCKVSPINLSMSTAAAGGAPYNPANGRLTVADHTFSVPGASGCSTFPINVNNEINSQLGLPSPSGQNDAVLSARSAPILQKAIVPAFTAAPSSGVFPLTVGFNASSTFHTRPIASYQWDFDNNGTFDQTTVSPTTSTIYATAGTKTIRLRVTDADGDSQETTRQVIVDTPRPDLTIAKSHSGSFVTGNSHAYSIDVTNSGTLAATDQITVTDTLPAGFSLDGFGGAGWNCGPQAGQDVTCTTDDDVATGASAPTLTLDVTAADPGTFVNTATVDVNGDPNASNDSAGDTTAVIQSGIDLLLVKTNDADDGLFRGHRATYVLDVSNAGTLSATERVRIVDDLPAGVEFVSAAGGLTWTCNYVAPQVRCFTDDDIAPGDTVDSVRIRVDVAPDAPDELLNQATVTVDGESSPDDNTAVHSGIVSGFATDYALAKSHSGAFIAGAPGFYNLSVTNVGSATGANEVTILDQLPAGLTYHTATGAGWSCSADGQNVTCEHAGEIEAGDSLPTLTLRADVAPGTGPSVTNTAGVFSADDFNVDNDVASDPTEVREPLADLAITKTHAGNFTGGSQGTYTIAVSNKSSEPAPGPTTVTDTLPAGLTFVSASGSGWGCGHAAGTVTCTRAAPIAGGASAPPITIVVGAALAAANTTVVNTAAVDNAHDANVSNDVASDPTVVADPQRATEMIAYPWLLHLSFFGGPYGSLLQGPAARLRSDGVPVAGKTITFRNNASNGSVICSGVTDATGLATCKPPLSWLLGLRSGSYRASFAGDAGYKASSTHASTIVVLGLGF